MLRTAIPVISEKKIVGAVLCFPAAIVSFPTRTSFFPHNPIYDCCWSAFYPVLKKSVLIISVVGFFLGPDQGIDLTWRIIGLNFIESVPRTLAIRSRFPPDGLQENLPLGGRHEGRRQEKKKHHPFFHRRLLSSKSHSTTSVRDLRLHMDQGQMNVFSPGMACLANPGAFS